MELRVIGGLNHIVSTLIMHHIAWVLTIKTNRNFLLQVCVDTVMACKKKRKEIMASGSRAIPALS